MGNVAFRKATRRITKGTIRSSSKTVGPIHSLTAYALFPFSHSLIGNVVVPIQSVAVVQLVAVVRSVAAVRSAAVVWAVAV